MTRPRRSRATAALTRKVRRETPSRPVQDKITVYLDVENVAWLDAQDFSTRSSALNDLVYKARNIYVRSEIDLFFEWLEAQKQRYMLGVQDPKSAKITGSISLARLVEAYLIETYGRPIDRGEMLDAVDDKTAPKIVHEPHTHGDDE